MRHFRSFNRRPGRAARKEVSILVVLDEALQDGHGGVRVSIIFDVSILVVLDEALQDDRDVLPHRVKGVSILVVLDEALQVGG